MSKPLSALVVWMVLLVGCSALVAPPSTPTPAYYPDFSISLWRGPCFGTCPVYSLEIDADGNVSYSGVEWVATIGKRSAKISPQQVEELVAAIGKAHVWALKDTYLGPTESPGIGLYITLNGQSKRIGHSGSLDCGKYDSAPMALCDLEHKIEATVYSDQWVKPISKPASNFPASKFSGDFGILSKEPCGPPCFQGIRPGVTPFEDARLILKNAGPPCGAGADTTWEVDLQGLVCKGGDATIFVVPDGRTMAVASIRLVPPVKVTVGQFIAQYGPPDALEVEIGAPRPAMLFYYDSLQTSVSVSALPGQASTITPDTLIGGVGYQTVADYQGDRSWAADHGFLQRWKGYGAY